MSTDLVPIAGSAELTEAVEAAAEFIRSSSAGATRRAYASDWRDFEAWCGRNGKMALPAEPLTVAAYLSALAIAGRKVSTIRRRCAAIGWKHSGRDNPAAHHGVKEVLAGIARERGSAPTKKAAMTADLVAKAVRKIPEDLAGLRDRALLLLGFAGAFRRSELVALDVADIQRHGKGIVITVRRSKGDQAGEGRVKAVPFGRKLQAVSALDAWLAAAKIKDGPLFRGVHGTTVLAGRLSDRQVARVVKARCAVIGLDPKAFAGHSLRRGFLTSAADHGADLVAMAKHAQHAKIETTLGYIEVSDAFANHAGRKFL